MYFKGWLRNEGSRYCQRKGECEKKVVIEHRTISCVTL